MRRRVVFGREEKANGVDGDSDVGSDCNSEEDQAGSLTPGQWSRRRRSWVVRRIDVVRGYLEKMDPVNFALYVAFVFLTIYSVYLFYCESCKEEYYELLR